MSCQYLLKPILDQVRAARAHGIRIPAELRDKAIMDSLVSYVKLPLSHANYPLGESGRRRVVFGV